MVPGRLQGDDSSLVFQSKPDNEVRIYLKEKDTIFCFWHCSARWLWTLSLKTTRKVVQRLSLKDWKAIPDTWEVGIGRISAWCQPGQKSYKDSISTNKPGTVVHNYNPSYLGKIGRRIMVQCWSQGKTEGLYQKNNWRKKGWGCGSSACLESSRLVPPKIENEKQMQINTTTEYMYYIHQNGQN
jgi:hypothetical protein